MSEVDREADHEAEERALDFSERSVDNEPMDFSAYKGFRAGVAFQKSRQEREADDGVPLDERCYNAGYRHGLAERESQIASLQEELAGLNRDLENERRAGDAILSQHLAFEASLALSQQRVTRLEEALKEILMAGQKTQMLGMDIPPKHGTMHIREIARSALAPQEEKDG